MSKAIASYPQEQRRAVIQRRLTGSSRGAGYWAAASAALKLGIPIPSKMPKAAPVRRKKDDDSTPHRLRDRVRRDDGADTRRGGHGRRSAR